MGLTRWLVSSGGSAQGFGSSDRLRVTMSISRSRYCLRAARAGCFGGLSALSSGKQI